MSSQVQFRRGTTTQNNAFTGAQGEITYDTDVKTLRLHDGSTAGGGAIVVTLAATQNLTNKTMSTGSIWSGNSIGLAYGGTGSSLTAAAGAIVYSTSGGLAINSAGTSGQLLQSAGTGTPIWVNASSLTTGTATNATNAANITGGSAGYLVYQSDTNTTAFIAPGTSGYILKSTGASSAPSWVTSDLTIGSTAVSVGTTVTSFAGFTALDGTAGSTSYFATPTSPVLFAGATTATIGYGSTASSTTNLSTGATGTGNTKTVNIGTGGAAGSTTNVNIGSSVAGSTTINSGTVVGANTTQAVFNTTATTVNAFGAATTLALGASTGTATIANPTVTLTNATALNLNGASPAIATTSTTASVFNSNVTTLNIGQTATTISLGATSGTTTVRNDLTVTGNLTINGTTTTNTSTNAAYADSLIEVHYSNGGTLTSDDGKDVGFRFHYFKTTDKNAALVLGNDSSQMEFYVTGTETSGVFSGTYGVFKGAGFNYTGSSSGTTLVQASAAASGTLTLPAATDTLVGRNTTDTLTNKTLTSPTLTTPTLGVASATSINKVAITAPATSSTITIADGTTLSTAGSVSHAGAFSQTFTATANTSLTLPTTGTLATLAGSEALTNKTVNGLTITSTTGTLTLANSSTLATVGAFSTTLTATATTTLTLPTTGTLATLAGSETLTNKTISGGTLTGTLTAGGSAGTSGYFLQSTGTGVQWAASTISLASGSGTASVSAGGTATFTGGTGVTTTATGSTVTFAIGQAVATTSAVTFASETISGSSQINSLGIGTAASGTAGEIRATSTITAYYSDDRLKTKTGNIQNALEKVLSLDGFHYHANETAVALGYDASKEEVGLSAQQVNAILPQVVAPAPIDPQYMTLHYERLVPLLVEAIKEQQKQIDELKAKLGN
jgi:hypothetical protein